MQVGVDVYGIPSTSSMYLIVFDSNINTFYTFVYKKYISLFSKPKASHIASLPP